MMKYILYLLFLIPLSFFLNFWAIQFMYFVILFFFMFSMSFTFDFLHLGYVFGLDLLSYMMIMLSIWICCLMLISSQKIYLINFYQDFFLIFLSLLLLSLLILFCSLNLFIFYLFFEFSLIPIFFLVIGWGFQPERMQAGIYLLFYTMFGSLPMIISLLYFYIFFNSMNFFFLNFFMNDFLYFCFNFVFFIKVPMYMIHMWLPKAHVEAPISGSMILAGVMLKLGGYGLIRFMHLFTLSYFLNTWFIVMSLFGGLIVSLICLRQNDIKSLIAYSSISHMSLVLSGILTLTLWGISGSFFLMIAHGLCSSGLFCLVNIVYERIFSRSMFLNKGLINLFPSLSLWWFFLCSSNMAFPPSLNLIGEIFLLNSLIGWCSYLMIILMFMMIFSGVYSLYLYSFTQHGKIYSGMFPFFPCLIREYFLLFLHWFPLNILFMGGNYFLFN